MSDTIAPIYNIVVPPAHVINTPKVQPKARVKNVIQDTEAYINYVVAVYDLQTHSEITTLPAAEDLPQVSSIQLHRGFLNVNSKWSVFYANNNKTINVGYINSQGEFVENERTSIISQLQNEIYDFFYDKQTATA